MADFQVASETSTSLSFGLAELALAEGCSTADVLRMRIRLDYLCNNAAFEEVVAFHIGDSSVSAWIMWHAGKQVFVESSDGNVRHYASIAEAFEDMAAEQSVVLTDIEASAWPA